MTAAVLRLWAAERENDMKERPEGWLKGSGSFSLSSAFSFIGGGFPGKGQSSFEIRLVLIIHEKFNKNGFRGRMVGFLDSTVAKLLRAAAESQWNGTSFFTEQISTSRWDVFFHRQLSDLKNQYAASRHQTRSPESKMAAYSFLLKLLNQHIWRKSFWLPH